jgi:hypothetical protein
MIGLFCCFKNKPGNMSSARAIILIICVFCSISINAQVIKSFSDDPANFPSEVQMLFSNITTPTNVIKIKDLLDPFMESWNVGVYNDEEKKVILGNANMLLSRKLTNYPDLYNYFSVIQNLKKKANREALPIWLHELSGRIPASNLRHLQSYLNQYELMVNENILYQSSTFTWYISDSIFRLEYDTAIRVIYRKADLVCATKKDSSRIIGTLGVFYPNTLLWIGQKGRVTWERVGLDPDSVYADLSAYKINMKYSEYQADTVRLINKRYFKEPLFGELIEKVLAGSAGPGSSYPQFNSYLKNYEIKNLFKNIDYIGGFSVEGARVIGSGEVNENATLLISRGGKIIAQIRSNAFRLMGEQITANPAALSILINGDSLYHPGLQMKYFDDKRQLVMVRPESGISQSPFFDGFHEIDMDCGAMYWNLDSNRVDFESMPGINRVSVNEFVSNNYFSLYDFYRIQGIDEKNPLYIIKDFSKKYGTDELTPDALAQFMNKSPEQIKAMMLKLSIQGFLYYDLLNDKAMIQDRLYRYIDASTGKRDYDVIRINSETDNISNATLNLSNHDLLVRGVKQVFLSDSQQVYIYPDNKEIIIKKGLDFVFSGNVKAGLFDFYAHECSFEYDSFKLNLPLVDSLSFQVKSFKKDDRGNRPLVMVKSVIENLSGKLLIDHPTNKSGLKSFPQFPIFDSEQESFVYYDHDTLYDRDRFAYHIYPFVLDSLDNFLTDNLMFDGYLVSAEIFPNIKQPLKVQPDYSLGFLHETPGDGYPVYSGRGQFFEEVNLSNRGLRGKGKLSFLTSVTSSDDFHFYPDSMITTLARHFTITPQVSRIEYPSVAADSISQVWYSYRDTMLLIGLKKPFRMYDEKALFYGELLYSPEGLYGNGKVLFESVQLASEKYNFRHHTVDADLLDFRLAAKGSGDLAVSAENYRTHVDFESRIVEFKTNKKGSEVSFPFNNFVCSMDNIDWYMDRQEMELYNDLGDKYADIDSLSREELLKLDLSGSDFVSMNPKADSVSFFSVTANYDLTKYIIDAQGVKLIRVADAAIFPDSGYVKISQGGFIQPLKNAAIIADTANRFHTIEKASVEIYSRNNYQAEGLYQYHRGGDILQEFPLSLIAVDSTGRTYAEGIISGDLKFNLDPFFTFKGKVSMRSENKELLFDGGFRTLDECFKSGGEYWVYFRSWIDPEKVRIPVGEPLVDLHGRKLNLAIKINDYEEDIYAAWLNPGALSTDTAMISATGMIYYDEGSGGYRISAQNEESVDPARPVFFYNTRNCTIEASGPLNLGLAYNYIDVTAFGNVRYLVIPDSAMFNVSLTFNFLFNETPLNAMADSLLLSDLEGLDVTGRNYQSFLDYEMGAAQSSAMKNDISIYGNIRKLPEELVHTMILTDVNLHWNSLTNSYISKGKIGIMSLGDNAVNRYVNGNIELIRRRSGDVITMYLEINPMKYYFFDYRNGVMQTISSDLVYNSRIEDLKPEKRTMTRPGLEETYEFLLSSRRKLIDFLRRMESL